ncbi:hypothetical protein SCAR479_08933 [Seiridium cardinale]|uniref:Uncharacterized protein n=1 Tax=Seiridium cardinale TaxID=138064 RepID=A0ABR2XKL2_9PEZI
MAFGSVLSLKALVVAALFTLAMAAPAAEIPETRTVEPDCGICE